LGPIWAAPILSQRGIAILLWIRAIRAWFYPNAGGCAGPPETILAFRCLPFMCRLFQYRPGVARHVGQLRSRQPGPPSTTKCWQDVRLPWHSRSCPLHCCARNGWHWACCSPSGFSDLRRTN